MGHVTVKVFMQHPAENKGCYVQKELAIYSKSVSRLKRIKRMTYKLTDGEYSGLQRALRGGFVYPGITGLDLWFSRDENLRRLLPDVINEQSFNEFAEMARNTSRKINNEIKERDKAQNDDIDWSVKIIPDEEKKFDNDSTNPKFLAVCRIREDFRPFYRFELFPDLKELSLTYVEFGNLFGSIFIDGFRALKNLESLRITIHESLRGTTFLFTALLQLPLLTAFSLLIDDMDKEEWDLFGRFVHQQKKIEEFHFDIRSASFRGTDYLQQNEFLKRTLQCLGSNLSLKSLHLDRTYVSLESLSQALYHLKMMNQLHTLKFKACDDTLPSREKRLKPAEGLCQFITNQKGSLRTLHVKLTFAVEDTLITYIVEAISQLSQLKELHFQCNGNLHSLYSSQKTFQLKISPELQKKLVLPEKWNPSFAQNFKKLANLEDFLFTCAVICTDRTDPISWLVDVVSILPDFEKLKTLELDLTFERGSLKEVRKMFIDQRICLPKIKNIAVWLSDLDRSKKWDLEETIEEINERQTRKNDYLFY